MASGRKQHIGNRNHLGLHLVPFERVDAIVDIIAAKKSLWRGWWAGGRLNINKPEHMGGDEKEGGISGGFDLMTGEVTQLQNDYLTKLYALSGVVASAFRGVVSIVLRQPYIGANTGRLPELAFKAVNTTEIIGGWKEDKALGLIDSYLDRCSIYIAFQINAGFDGLLDAAPLAAALRALKGSPPNNVKLVAFKATAIASMERFKCTDQDYEDLALWVESLVGDSYTHPVGMDYNSGVADAAAFFATSDVDITVGALGILQGKPEFVSMAGGGQVTAGRRNLLFFMVNDPPDAGTDLTAEATLDAIPDLERFVFYMQEKDHSDADKLDNTPQDGTPVVELFSTTAFRIQQAAGIQWVDINWVHHVRYLLITKKRGGRATADDIGSSFDSEADLAYDEGMFLSVPYSSYGSNMECINDIKRHVDAHVYRSRATGKWECRSIRGGNDASGLTVFDDSIVSDWSGLERVAASESANQVTVTYTKRDEQEPGSVTKANVAAVRRVGQIIPGEPIDFPLVTVRGLATQLCAREASVVSVPLLSGTIPLLYLPQDLDIGSSIVLNKPELRINNVIVVVQELTESDGVSGGASIRVTEHRYDLGQAVADNDAPKVVQFAQPSDPRIVMEAPYYVLVLNGTQADTDGLLADVEELGFLFAIPCAPTPIHYSATLAVDSGAGYMEDREVSFYPNSVLQTALTRAGDDQTVTIELNQTLETVEVNDLASIGDEIVRIDDMVVSGGSIVLTIGRACLDTAPVAHEIGEDIIFWGRGDPSEDRYVQTESVDVKFITDIAGDTLPLDETPVDTLVFDARAIRPYPPGQFKINGSYADGEYYDDAVLTWAHRDRLQQTTLVPEDHDDGNIGPEAGTTYTVNAEAFSGGVSLGVIYTATGIAGTTHDYPDATAYPDGTEFIRLSVTSVRDSYESWQSPAINIRVAPVLGVNGFALGVNGNILGLKG